MKNRTLTIIASSALALALAIGPTAALAKNDNASLHGRAKAQASTTTKASCTRAFGHLIAPGWKRMNGTTTVSTACKLPAGIARKLGLGPIGTTTPDTSAPIISLISSNANTTSATVTWFTNENATTQLAFGTTTAYGATTTLNSSLGLFHSVTLSGLTASTTYHFQVMSRDAVGNTSVSSDRTFTTSAGDTTSPALSAISVSGIGSTTAQVSWTTNEPATSKVFFAAGPSLNLATASTVSSSALLTTHAMILGGLSASTTYSYAVQSQDAFGNASTSATSSFVTGL